MIKIEIREKNTELEKTNTELAKTNNELYDIKGHLEELVQERTREVEQQKDDIISSIQYAQKIQKAVLPQEEYISEVLKESFIYYKPKDLVSGDFYWLAKKDVR